MTLKTFFEKFDLFADAPDAVARMRELVLQLAVQGKLVEQNPAEESALDCLGRANEAVMELKPDESRQTPDGWLATYLGCLIASNTGGGTPSKSNPDYWNGSIPWASVKDIQREKFLLSTIDSITEEGLRNSSSNLIPVGRLLVVTRMGLGKLAINRVPVAINQDLRAIEPTTALDLDFAYLLFKSLKMVGAGVTVKGITVDKLHSMPVAVPPLAEQKRIVAKVDELMGLCDRLEAEQQERETRQAALARASLARFAEAPTPANLNLIFHPSYAVSPADLRKSILTLAVQGKLVPQDPNDEDVRSVDEFRNAAGDLAKSLGLRLPKESFDEAEPQFDVPANWRWMSLADIGAAQTGTTPSKADHTAFNGEIPFIKPADIFPNTVDYSNESLTRQGAENGSRLAPAGSLLMVCIGTIGKCNLIDRECAFNQQINSLSPIQWIEPQYLLTAARASYFHEAAWAKSSSTTIPILNKGKWLSIPIPVPPLAEQRRIVAKVDELMALVDALETQLATARRTAASLLTAALAELTAA